MKRRNDSGLAKVVGASLLLFGILTGSYSQTPPELAPELRDKNVMKFKLYYAQGVLEAIATENYALLATNAQHLDRLTRQVSWRIRHTPEYERLTSDFQRTTTALAKAAKDENVDAATVAYFQMTVACVTCHRHLKDRLAAFQPETVTRTLLAVSGGTGSDLPLAMISIHSGKQKGALHDND